MNVYATSLSVAVIESHAYQKRGRAELTGTPPSRSEFTPPPSDLHVLATPPFPPLYSRLTAHRQYKKTRHIYLMSLGKSSQELR
ncbi:hypothetical protein PILCRDRAFT_185184 [Piloderma croceum F 1598]|uniref:Uncharacterized protein n=1 Tax=Piloderma croceum (strain F 1598) TaxID=765440 RepID=A0A0C3CLF1_PILCF|nr:hypothetical protein PILCRDRAFT_185184 [Piloderma croceum F 1598]